MLRRKIFNFFILSMLAVASIACGSAQVGLEETPSVQSEQPVVSNVPQVATGEPTLRESTADCPKPNSEQSLYVSTENGFCFLVPLSIKIEIDPEWPQTAVILRGPSETPGSKQMELATVWMRVSYNGPADGFDAEGYARKWFDMYARPELPDVEFVDTSGTIGGHPVVTLSHLPGMISSRSAFIVANGHKYQIRLTPEPENAGELLEPVTQLWATVVNSIVFFEQGVVRNWPLPEQVCPEETEQEKLYKNEREGYCYLYPADFEVDPDFPIRIIGGPVVGTDPDFGELRESIAVGLWGPLEGKTPRQVVEGMLDLVDPNSLMDTRIGDYPATIYLTNQPPWPHRIAMIDVNGRSYTVTAQPVDAQRFPLGIEPLERLWVTVTGSLAFFEPFR